jgi:DNA-binding NtrC family response regulator
MSEGILSGLLIGQSPPMQKLRALVARVATATLSVLIEGETGTGKELVAQALHQGSSRNGTLICVNVCAIADTMFEDALFGHVQGAYTGAVRATAGYMVEANGGTLFLDEIGGLTAENQAKLLRAVETREFRPVGGTSDRRSDFRVVAASNESLEALAQVGQFRWDLAHRLSGIRLQVPPLRTRADDIPALVDHLVSKLPREGRKGFSEGAIRALQGHHWPGNVRQLRNVVEASLIVAQGGRVERADVTCLLNDGPAFTPRRELLCHDTRDALLLEELRATEGDVTEAARRLGLHRATVYRRLRRLEAGISKDESPPLRPISELS